LREFLKRDNASITIPLYYTNIIQWYKGYLTKLLISNFVCICKPKMVYPLFNLKADKPIIFTQTPLYQSV